MEWFFCFLIVCVISLAYEAYVMVYSIIGVMNECYLIHDS